MTAIGSVCLLVFPQLGMIWRIINNSVASCSFFYSCLQKQEKYIH